MEPVKRSFTNLKAWQQSHLLVLDTYQATKSFPKEEIFGLTSQMRRCAVSITSNIAEGYSRHTYTDKVRFYSIALGSLTELQNQLLIARDVGYLRRVAFSKLADSSVQAHKLLSGLIKKSKVIRDS